MFSRLSWYLDTISGVIFKKYVHDLEVVTHDYILDITHQSMKALTNLLTKFVMLFFEKKFKVPRYYLNLGTCICIDFIYR